MLQTYLNCPNNEVPLRRFPLPPPEFPNMTVMTIHIHSESTCSSSAAFHHGHVTVKLVIACSVTFVLPYVPSMFDVQLCVWNQDLNFSHDERERVNILQSSVYLLCLLPLWGCKLRTLYLTNVSCFNVNVKENSKLF